MKWIQTKPRLFLYFLSVLLFLFNLLLSCSPKFLLPICLLFIQPCQFWYKPINTTDNIFIILLVVHNLNMLCYIQTLGKISSHYGCEDCLEKRNKIKQSKANQTKKPKKPQTETNQPTKQNPTTHTQTKPKTNLVYYKVFMLGEKK